MSLATPTRVAPAPPAAAPAAPAAEQGNLLSWAYHDYCRQQEAGIAPDPEEYCARFPSIQAALADLLSVHRLVHGDIHFTDPPEVRWPEPGEEFAGFRLERELGRGRFSHVFLASEPALGHRRVVVKIALGGMDEALTLGRLAHPNIVPIFSVRKDEATGLAVVCMPYLGEATLADLVAGVRAGTALPRDARAILEAAARGQTLEPPAATDTASAYFLGGAGYVDGVRHLAIRLLDALAFIHAEGVCHRDLKPSNVLLTRAGVPMLLDFNLSGDVRHVRLGLGGTPTYMAPEQLQRLGRHDGSGLDGRADLFSLGVILFELLTGRHPFAAPPPALELDQTRHFLLKQQQAGAAPLRSHNPAVDRALAGLVDQCLAFAPADRPVSAPAARALLDVPASRWRQRCSKFLRQRGLAFALGLPFFLSGGTSWLAIAPAPTSQATAPDEFELGRVAYRRGDYPEAHRHFDLHVHAVPRDARGWLQRGIVALKLKHYDLAVMDFARADQLRPDGLTKACLAYAFHESDQPKEARYYLEQAVAARYAPAEVKNNLGFLHLSRGALAEAEHHLTQALERAPHLQAAYHNRGLVFIKKAMQGPRMPSTPRGRSIDRIDRKLLRRALSDFTQALAVGPPSGELHHDMALACVYLSAEDPSFAAKALDHLANGIRLGLDPLTLGQRPFPKYLDSSAAYRSLRIQPRVAHPMAMAQRFLAMPIE